MSEDYSNNIINNDNNNIINDNNNISNDNNNQSKLKSLGDEIRTVMEISIGKKPESIREAELQEKNKQIAEEIRKKLRIDTNPLIPNLETIDNNINQLEQLKEKLSNNPLTQYTNIDTNKINKSIEYLNTSKNNSAHNIIKNGTDNTTVLYKDNNNQTKAIDLTGEELITEDTDNIYIDDVIIPKHTTKTQTLQDIYTKQELAKLKQTNPNYRPMTDSEWLEEINKEREYNYSLNKTLTKEMSILANDIPQDLKAEIDYLDPLGIDEYMFLTAKMKKLQPIIEIASDKLNAKQTITKEEYEALQTARYITYSMQSRGISTRARIIPGAIQMGKDSLIGALVMFTTDWLINAGIGLATYATGGLTAPIASIRAVQQIRKYSKIFNNARKKYKVLKYTWNTGKLIGYQMAGAKLDTISRTFLFDVMPFLGENREQRITAKRNNQMLEFTDKGGLFINDISQDMEDFLERQDDVEQYDEALGERIVAPLLRPIINAFPIPSNIANSIFAKAIKKINNFPRIAGTSFDGILEEHAEEVFTSILNHLRKANDPNTTLGQTLTEYFNPKNFTINTINMMISGGIIKALHPTFSENKDNSQTQSLNRATVKTYFKNLFNKNPNLILNDNNNVNNINNNNNNNTSNNNNTLGSIDQYNYKNIIDNLPETEIDKLAKDIYKKDEEQLEAKYQEQKNNLKNNLISSGITETEANNLIKLFEGNYENLARSLGVSKSDMVEELKLMVENKNINDLENNEDIKTFYQKRPEIYTTINEVLELSNQQGTFNKKYKIGDVSNWLVEEAKKNNLDLTNYSHNIDVSAVKHIKKQHGDIKTEEKRGQIAITDEDIKNIPYVINNPDYIILGTKNDRKQDSIIYVKNMDDGTSVYVEEVRDGRKTLTATTLFKRKKSLATADATSILKSLSLTSETPLGSIKIIPNPKSKVNKNNNTYLQTAFHGSPYSFDKFTLDHIGEGEGAQVHGYGLYFALDKNIAKNYRDFLSIKKEQEQYLKILEN